MTLNECSQKIQLPEWYIRKWIDDRKDHKIIVNIPKNGYNMTGIQANVVVLGVLMGLEPDQAWSEYRRVIKNIEYQKKCLQNKK